MRTVCVIGGGTAGAEAAREASRDGAEVTVLERSHKPEPPWRVWPDLIQHPESPTEVEGTRLLVPPDVTVINAEIKAVRGSSVVLSDGSSIRFDAVVAATGSGFAPLSLRGCRKPGVHQLRTAGAYQELGRCRGLVERPVVMGEGTCALRVADLLSGEGRRVRAVASGWRHGMPSPDVFDALKRAAGERGVSMVRGPIDGAVGEPRVEAVLIGGRVIPSDALVLIPKRIPRAVTSDAALGASGGLSVNSTLSTSSPSFFAAGGCAELLDNHGRPHVLDEEPRMSGRIAGANSVGHGLAVGSTPRAEASLFGLRWSVSEADLTGETAAGATRGVISRRWGPESACTITYERRRGMVLRVECLEPACKSSVDAAASAPGGPSLLSLAFGDSSDISLVSDTARLGLRLWSNS